MPITTTPTTFDDGICFVEKYASEINVFNVAGMSLSVGADKTVIYPRYLFLKWI